MVPIIRAGRQPWRSKQPGGEALAFAMSLPRRGDQGHVRRAGLTLQLGSASWTRGAITSLHQSCQLSWEAQLVMLGILALLSTSSIFPLHCSWGGYCRAPMHPCPPLLKPLPWLTLSLGYSLHCTLHALQDLAPLQSPHAIHHQVLYTLSTISFSPHNNQSSRD